MELAQLVFESMRIGDRDSGRQHRKTPDADVHADHGRRAVAGRDVSFDLDGE
jgi:hypothetical protein